MPQFKIEYRSTLDGAVLRSNFVLADSVADAEAEAKKAFTNIQVVGGARQYRVLNRDGEVVAHHEEKS
jgi:hypothetical protein